MSGIPRFEGVSSAPSLVRGALPLRADVSLKHCCSTGFNDRMLNERSIKDRQMNDYAQPLAATRLFKPSISYQGFENHCHFIAHQPGLQTY